MRYIAFESRRAVEIGELIRRQGGDPFVAPSMREVPIENNPEAFAFAERLFRGDFDMVILLTGVGTRALNQVIESRYPGGRFPEALKTVTVVARGPKPMAVLREWGVPVTIPIPEPNTWREILQHTEGRPERRIAIQEYGRTNSQLVNGLRSRGAEVTTVRVYQWDLPADTGPLREATRRLVNREAEVAVFTTSAQVDHLFKIAAEEGIENALRDCFSNVVVASIGPTTTEALEEFGVRVDFVPSHPKMGFLVKELAEQAPTLLQRKRG
ncbi:MAG TPA: uroporphyrinogen-III synthase [Bryobacteraceae bacterium]|nr:uroporphyrinogen-III synthase [Bryobacteraceae bacterium]